MRSFELTTRMTPVKRSGGRSATAAAAYRSGTKIECSREGQTHDYTRKQGVAATGLVLPDGSPAMTRAELWNAAEHRENRKNSQTAREYLFSLPSDLSADRRQAVVERIAAHMVDKHGVAVDWAIHEPHRAGDDRNHHCHMLMTTRRMENGKLTDKTRELDDRKTGAQIAKDLRAHVAREMNTELERQYGKGRAPVYVEHESFKARGIDREPQKHKGVIRSNMERRGIRLHSRVNRARDHFNTRAGVALDKRRCDDQQRGQALDPRAQQERSKLEDQHQKQRDAQTNRHQIEASKHRQKWAVEGRERVERIKADLAKAERADKPLSGLKWLKALLLRRTAKENDARIQRSQNRHAQAGDAIEAQRQHYRRQREDMQRQQMAEVKRLQEKQDKEREQMAKVHKERERLAEIKRETGRDVEKEIRERRQKQRE